MVAEKVERHHGQEDEDSGNQDPWVAREILDVLRLCKEVSPACGGLLDSEPEQRERALAEDEAGNRQRRGDDRVAEHRRNDMSRDNAPSRSAERSRRLDVR